LEVHETPLDLALVADEEELGTEGGQGRLGRRDPRRVPSMTDIVGVHLAVFGESV